MQERHDKFIFKLRFKPEGDLTFKDKRKCVACYGTLFPTGTDVYGYFRSVLPEKLTQNFIIQLCTKTE